MKFFLILVIAIFLIVCLIKKLEKNKRKILSFNKRSKEYNRKKFLRTFKDRDSNILSMDPEKNIRIKSSDKEVDLREKADIHKVRLNKFGRSKLNGKVYFKGPRGGVFTLSRNGNKAYV